MSTHIGAKLEDISNVVLMPGDPIRAKVIASTYLEDYKLVNEVRGMLAYTGFYKGKKVTVMASGMGMPSIGIYSYELFSEYDVDVIIRIGSAGAYKKELKLYDLLLVKESYTRSTYGKVQNGSLASVLKSNEEIDQLLLSSAHELKKELKPVKVECEDVFYKEKQDTSYLNEMGILACEMESYALFHNANLLGKKASCLLTVSNNWETGEETTASERQNAFMDMVEVALLAAVKIED
jgi:purine-nucleoside phosphorylase